MRHLLLVIFLVSSSALFAQRFTLEGHVKDEGAVALEGATVYVQSLKDSITMAYGITNKAGEFSININSEGEPKLLFNVAYLGYKPYAKDIAVPAENKFDMGTVTLADQIEELNVVSIIGKAPPIVIKKDTIEYNADSFKTLANDRAEDLLKKLPGVEFDIDGNITVNGVAVEAINVDGMAFFGEKMGDIALKNLPSNVISKVQVTDYKTNLQKFTGEESDSGTKEINIKIKKGKNKAFFGDINGGYGTDDKYQGNANLFQMIDGKQIGFISGTNNINMRRGFTSLPDARSSNGYVESDFIGANYSKGKWNETRVNGNYKYSASNEDNSSFRYRDNFLPNLNYTTTTESNSSTDSDNHSGDLDLKFIIPSKNKSSNNKIQISNELKFNRDTSDSFSESTTESISKEGEDISDYNANSESNSVGNSIDNSIGAIVRTGSGRDFFNFKLSTNFSGTETDSKNYSENVLYQRNTTQIQDQIRTTDNTTSNINLNGYWFKELFTNFRIIPKYNATIYHNKNEKKVFDYNETDADYTDFNTLQSFDSKYVTTTLKPALRFRYEWKDIRFEVEGAYTNTFRKYTDILIAERNFNADFNYFTYSSRIRYRDQNGYKNISLDYNQNVDLPSANQLQPVENVSNQTHIYTGNPDLEPGLSHNLRFQYQNNLAFNNITINGEAKAVFTEDKIINSTITDDDLIKYTTYDNMNGDYSLNGNASISKSYFSQNTNINMNAKFAAAYNNNISVQNGVKFSGKNTVYTPSVGFKYSYNNKLDFGVNYSYSTNETRYDTGDFNDNKYFVQNIKFDSSIFFLKNAFFSNKIAYTYNSRVGDDFDGDAVFWNAGLGVQLWNNKGTLTLVGYDILGKNNGYRRSVTETYIQDIENKILEQYFMVTFSFKFGKIAGQNMNVRPDRQGGGGGGRGQGGGRRGR
ncbi:outer membrane beta-barrel protein [Algibacter miyuki]|uniref:Outer membrane beta-barrel protein n=1 Tax=Algibacter miyuki TaxID=1306933 RepID=A0ABV5H371_9FLAO|nr:outer membrane beta-barrel protein [Algibacter miyuki]MDN3665398.1 outer membrane beta-barrel protein [Algibacter miyuki]